MNYYSEIIPKSKLSFILKLFEKLPNTPKELLCSKFDDYIGLESVNKFSNPLYGNGFYWVFNDESDFLIFINQGWVGKTPDNYGFYFKRVAYLIGLDVSKQDNEFIFLKIVRFTDVDTCKTVSNHEIFNAFYSFFEFFINIKDAQNLVTLNPKLKTLKKNLVMNYATK